MGISLYNLFEAGLLCINAIAVLHEKRFLNKINWGRDQNMHDFEPGAKSQIVNLIHSVRTVTRIPLIAVNSLVIWSEMARDYNQMLDDITLAQNRYRQMGFTRGFSLGEEVGFKEGYQLGLQRGAQLATELGFYQGFVHAWITILEQEDAAKHRKLLALRGLLEMAKSFPRNNVPDQDLMENLHKIRAKFKQVVTMLDACSADCMGAAQAHNSPRGPEMSF